MKYVAYYRVSTQRQGQSGLGLEAQKTAVTNAIEVHAKNHCEQATLLGSFQDIESGKKNQREGLTKALELCRQEKAFLVIAKIDRLTRNIVFLFQLKESGIQFFAADLPEFNTLTLGIHIVMAQHERELISERTKRALSAKKAQGFKLGTPDTTHCFGDGNGESGRKAVKRNADERASKIYRVIKAMRDSGSKLQEIANQLNSMSYPTARGGVWTRTTVKNVIDRMERNEKKS